jgi:carbon storage regulator CsrA
MLILSRRENEKILFPNLGVTVGIVRIRGNAVRVGIEAPEGVRVLREEIADEQALQASRAAFDPLRKLRHELRNRLNTANLALHLVQKQMETGKSHDAESALRKALEELHVLDREIGEKTRSFNRKNAARHHALVVEDNANERELLAGCLRLYGFDVDAVEDGLSALHFLEQRQGRPDCILLDMQMPRLNGAGTVTAIRGHPEWHNLRLFAVTGTERHESNIPLGPTGVDRWFVKPINPQELLDELNRDLQPAGTPA